MAGAIAYLYLLLGIGLGSLSPLAGLGLLVGFVAVTPSLPWQLGLQNLAYPLLFATGLLIGDRLNQARTVGVEVGEVRLVTRLTDLAVLTLLVASAVSAAVRLPLTSAPFRSEVGASLGQLTAFNPGGLAGVLQAVLIPLTGLLLFRMASRALAVERARARFERAFLLGCMVAAAAPILQWLFLDPTVRPDRGSDESVGLVGWFHDPHSFAAYLVLAIGFLLGVAAERRQLGSRHGPQVDWRLAAGVAAWLFVLVLFTNSRSGLGAALVCLTVFVVLVWLLGDPDLAPGRRRLRFRIAAATALALVVLAAGLVFSPAVRGVAYGGLSKLGNPRMWELLRPEGPEHPLFVRRALLWTKARELTGEHPVWGSGPRGFVESDVPPPAEELARIEAAYGPEELRLVLLEVNTENAHNYFLQYGAEFGIPALFSLLALLAVVLGVTLRYALRRAAAGRALLCGVLAGQLGFLAMCLVSHPLLLAEMQAVFWTVAAFGLTMARLPRPESAGA